MTTQNTVPFPFAREYNEKEIDHNQIYINNIYIRVRAREDLQLVQSCYHNQLGYWPTPAILEQMEKLLDSGAEASLLCAVMEYTAQKAPRPSWAYAAHVLRRKLQEGVKNAEAFNRSCEAYYRGQAAPAYKAGYYKARVIEQCYSQRHYDPEEYDDIPEDLLEDMRRLSCD